MSKVSRRELLKWIGLGSVGVALAACKPTAAPTQAPTAEGKAAEEPTAAPEAEPAAEAITLRWVVNHSAAEMENFQRVVDNWHDDHPDIQIDFLNIPGGDEYYNAINTQAVGGDLPDLFYCRSFDTQPFASRGWIVNLDPFIDALGIDTSDFWEAQIPQLSYEGSIYALPYDFSNWAFYYNKDLLEEIGLEPPPDDWDFDLLEEICEKMVLMEEGKPVRWATTWSADPWGVLGRIVANGGRFWDEEGRTCTLASEENVEWFERLVRMRKKGIFPEGGVLPQGVNPWTSGLVVMNMNGSWATQALREQVGDQYDFDVVGMPYNKKTGMRGVGAAGGAWSVGVSTAHLDEAVMLCDHVTSTESCNILIAEPVRSIPGRKSSVDLWVKNATSAGLPPANVEIFARQMEEKMADEPYPPFWKDFNVVWGNRIPPMVYGGGDTEIDVREQLESAQEEVQEVIDLYWETA
ncbi:MAG: extracellular solute-binding protein [Anaerolineae bacterium]